MAAGAAASLHRLADEVVLIGAVCRYLTGRFSEAAAMAADARATGRDRHDPVVHLWDCSSCWSRGCGSTRATRRPPNGSRKQTSS
jgi:hypothetical protein